MICNRERYGLIMLYSGIILWVVLCYVIAYIT